MEQTIRRIRIVSSSTSAREILTSPATTRPLSRTRSRTSTSPLARPFESWRSVLIRGVDLSSVRLGRRKYRVPQKPATTHEKVFPRAESPATPALYLVYGRPRKAEEGRAKDVRQSRRTKDRTIAARGVVDEPGPKWAPGRHRPCQGEEKPHERARLFRSEKIPHDRREERGNGAGGKPETEADGNER